MKAIYDEIGIGYAQRRRPDPRIAASIEAALTGCDTIVNVGAGTGSYEPAGRTRLAVELSREMIRQRSAAVAPAVRSTASAIPLRDGAVDAALAVLTIHHWEDRELGLRECARVARRRVVLLTWDPNHPVFWLADYLPEIAALDRPIFPASGEFERCLGPCETSVVPVPADCSDGFLGAYWRRPAAYLDESVRRSISIFGRIPDIAQRLEPLRADLESGRWAERNADLLGRDTADLGYRLVVASRA